MFIHAHGKKVIEGNNVELPLNSVTERIEC